MKEFCGTSKLNNSGVAACYMTGIYITARSENEQTNNLKVLNHNHFTLLGHILFSVIPA